MTWLARCCILATGIVFAACATPSPATTTPPPSAPTSSAGAPTSAAQEARPTTAPTNAPATAAAPTVAAAATPPPAPSSSAGTAPPLERTLALRQSPLQGADVETLQQRLLALGYQQLGAADGVFGARTEAAVRAFQSINQLDVDGIVGPNTWARLHAPDAVRFDLHAIVDTQRRYLLGASNGTRWITSDVAADLIGETSYRLLRQTGDAAAATGTAPLRPKNEPCEDTPFVTFLEQIPAGQPIGIAADWQPVPRAVTELPTDAPELQAPLAASLRVLGIANPSVKITRALRADLDGNGSPETIIASTYHADGTTTPLPTAQAGDYSALFVLADGAPTATVIESDVITRDIEFGAPLVFTLLGLWDLNNDGTIEIAATSDYYEGASTSIYTFDGSTTQQVLTAGCGV